MAFHTQCGQCVAQPKGGQGFHVLQGNDFFLENQGKLFLENQGNLWNIFQHLAAEYVNMMMYLQSYYAGFVIWIFLHSDFLTPPPNVCTNIKLDVTN